MKRYRLVALALAMGLVFCGLGAHGEAMSAKEFVERVLAPNANENNDECWSWPEAEVILRLGEERGLTLSGKEIASLRDNDGVDKEQLMKLYAQIDLGFDPDTWSVADQAWYDRLLVDCGFRDYRVGFVPGEGEISQEEAVDVAIRYIHEHYDEDADVANESLYRRHMSYTLGYGDEDKHWEVYYEELDLTQDAYQLRIGPQGDVLAAWQYKGLRLEGGDISSPDEVCERYEDLYGVMSEWEPETWISFKPALEKAAAAHGELRASQAYILGQEYGMPDAEALTKWEAIQKAALAVVEKGLVEEGQPQPSRASAVYLLDGERAVWKVTIASREEEWYWVEMDAHSGEIQKIGGREGAWYFDLVLDSIVNAPIQRPALPGGFLPQDANTTGVYAKLTA